ncbi:MAG: hypothetical protein LIP23_05120 [Planctomycetes bacterium]|nr:hypothetical protein [Planctomycetota bacterium]
MAKKEVDARTSMFGRLAMESGLVTYDDIVACIEEQDRIRADGGTPPRLGEVMVERGILTQGEVEQILRMQSNPSGLIGRQLLEKGLVTREQLKEVLDEQAEFTRAGQTPPKLGELMVERGMIKRSDLEQLLKKKEAPGGLFGEFLVSNRLVKEEDITKVLAMQKEATDKGEKPQPLGALLVTS